MVCFHFTLLQRTRAKHTSKATAITFFTLCNLVIQVCVVVVHAPVRVVLAENSVTDQTQYELCFVMLCEFTAKTDMAVAYP